MSFTIDAHNDTLMRIIDLTTLKPVNDIGEPTKFQIDLPKMEAGGISGALFAAFTPGIGSPDYNNSVLLAMMHGLDWTIAKHPNRLFKCLDTRTLVPSLDPSFDPTFTSTLTSTLTSSLTASPKKFAIQTIEGAYGCTEENALGLIDQYADLGVKAIALVWNHSNALGEGTARMLVDKTPTQYGLTPLGRQVVGKMQSKGILVDVSHMDQKTFWDVATMTEAPLIASHSGAYTIHPHPRNLTDSQLLEIKKSGGIACAIFYPEFLGPDATCSYTLILKHIHHMVSVIGTRHVGLGSDFDGADMPHDMPDISHLCKISDGLLQMGYSDLEVANIMGDNLLCVLNQVAVTPAQVLEGTCQGILKGTLKGTITLSLTQHESVIDPLFWINGLSHPVSFDSDSNALVATLSSPLPEAYYLATFQIGKADPKRKTIIVGTR